MIKKIVIILTTLLVFSLGIYVVYDKIRKQTDDNLQNWMTYLLESDIQEISITKTSSVLTGADEDYREQVYLTKDELKNIFQELNNYNLEKIYSGGIGFAGNDLTFIVTYLVDNQLYKFQIIRGGYILGNKDDSELLKLFNANNYTTHKDYEVEDYYFKYVVDKEFNSIFEKHLDYYTA